MDSSIKSEFDRCEAEGLCRSDVAGLRMRWVQGWRHMVSQYHPTWQLAKRKPYFTQPRMDEPFSPDSFNFTKVKPEEVLAKIYVKDGIVHFADKNETEPPEGVSTLFTVLLNVSPICNNHHLIVPNLAKCYNQVWRYDITEEFVTLCENSECDDYVLFFNSLGGFSSVNHLHLQVMYTRSFYETASGQPSPPLPPSFSQHKLPVEYIPSNLLFKKGNVIAYDIPNWLSQTIKLSVEITEDMTADEKTTRRHELSEVFNELIRMCYEYQYPYDIVFCQYGHDIYTFIRKYQQPLDDLKVNPACVELTGIVVYRSEEAFDNANEDILVERCKEVVHFDANVWETFLQTFKNRVEN